MVILPAVTAWKYSAPRGAENIHELTAGSISLLVDLLGLVWDVLGSSIYLQIGFVLVAAGFVLSVINGLIEIAMYIALLTGIVLLILGGLHWIDPGLVPIHLLVDSVLVG